jgi:hypothetical protein
MKRTTLKNRKKLRISILTSMAFAISLASRMNVVIVDSAEATEIETCPDN